jgi:hypothetical protein
MPWTSAAIRIDDASLHEDLRRAIRSDRRERLTGIVFVVLLVGVLAWSEGP